MLAGGKRVLSGIYAAGCVKNWKSWIMVGLQG